MKTLTLFFLTLGILLPQLAMAQKTALGNWEFDDARKEVYLNSVKARQTDQTMSEIALQMGMAKYQNSKYELGADKSGAFLRVFDRTTNKRKLHRLSVVREGNMLRMTDQTSGEVLTAELVKDNDHMNLTFKTEEIVVPLKRL